MEPNKTVRPGKPDCLGNDEPVTMVVPNVRTHEKKGPISHIGYIDFIE
jgi:hypothetical protein